MIFNIDGLEIHITDIGDRMVAHVMDGSGFEPESLEVWAKLIKPGRVALDIGGYTGLFAIIAAMRGARAYTFEPLPANRWRVGINAALNKVHINVISSAVSDHDGKAMLHFNPKVPLTTGASLERKEKAHHQSVEVATVTIDSLNIEDVCAIKIDVEHHEAAVVRGAIETIRRDRPVLLIETLDDAARASVLKLLPAPYRVAAILDTRNTLFTPN
jgi:FkbM family methyltransferase